METKHEWYDAWVLLAVLIAGRPSKYATLADIIGAADMINHAIPTNGELDGALDRLLRNNWIEQTDLQFAPSSKAEAMFSCRRERRTANSTDLEFIRASIGAEEWDSTYKPAMSLGDYSVQDLNEAVLDDAYRAYKKGPGRNA